MKRAIISLIAVLPLTSAGTPRAPCLWHIPVRLDVYEMAEVVTGAPSRILRGIARTESDEDDLARGDDGVSVGRFQLNERFHRERAARYGEYNPFDPLEAARIAGCLYVDNLRELSLASHVADPDTWAGRRRDFAIAAHRQGCRGVRRNGPCPRYVYRVGSGG
jgi:hypothetical protein